jgi:hypothetical protein
MHALVLLERPDLRGEVIRARGEQGTAGVPLDGVHFVLMAGELFQRLLLAHLADIDHLIGRAGGKGGVVPPVHIERRGFMELKLLSDFAGSGVPDNGRLVNGAAEQ